MAFISEIHYRNVVAGQTGVAEYVEVTLSPAELARVSDFRITTYQTDGSLRSVLELSDVTPVLDPNTGFYVFELPTTVTDPDHLVGSNEAEAVALIDAAAAGPVVSFFDIGGGTGPITAVEGPAAGATSVNIPPAAGQSIRFDAFGNRLDGDLTRGSSVICLTDGTLIDTPDGPRAIESLRIGDLVTTRDSGAQRVRMIHARRLERADLEDSRALWPVRIAAGALGFGLPRRDLWVSPQHRMLYAHIRIGLMFGEDAVLVRAKSLAAALPGVAVDGAREAVTYYHLVFDAHEIIYAEGAATESFHPGKEAIAALDGEARTELYALFPGLRAGRSRTEADFLTLRSWELRAAVA